MLFYKEIRYDQTSRTFRLGQRKWISGFVTDWNLIQWHSYFKMTVLTTRNLFHYNQFWSSSSITTKMIASRSDNNHFIIEIDERRFATVMMVKSRCRWFYLAYTNIQQLSWTFLVTSLVSPRFRLYKIILWSSQTEDMTNGLILLETVFN